MRELHLFAGAGGGILGGMLLGHKPVCAVEIEPYCQDVLRARQRDGILPDFPIHGDIREFDGTKWRGAVDVVCGGFPCQDISAAGKGAGITGKRSGLWSEMARVIGEVGPQFVFIENSPLLRTRGLGTVLQDLAQMGYDARWGVLGAWHVGAPHKRDRMWILASDAQRFLSGACQKLRPQSQEPERKDTSDSGCLRPAGTEVANTVHPRLQRNQCTGRVDKERRQEPIGSTTECGSLWWHTDPAEGPTEPIVGRVAHGVAHRVDRLKAIGNGQVPAVAATAFRILSDGLI